MKYEQMPFLALCELMADEKKGVPQPVMNWPDAAYEPLRDNRGNLYKKTTRDHLKKRQVAIPGKVYTKALSMWKDNLKMAYRVHYPPPGMSLNEYRRFKYETSLKSLSDEDSQINQVMRSILKELLNEIPTPEPVMESPHTGTGSEGQGSGFSFIAQVQPATTHPLVSTPAEETLWKSSALI